MGPYLAPVADQQFHTGGVRVDQRRVLDSDRGVPLLCGVSAALVDGPQVVFPDYRVRYAGLRNALLRRRIGCCPARSGSSDAPAYCARIILEVVPWSCIGRDVGQWSTSVASFAASRQVVAASRLAGGFWWYLFIR